MTRPICPLALAVGVLAASTGLGSSARADAAKPEPTNSAGGASAQPAPAQPAPATPAEMPSRDAELEALKQTLEQLRKRIEELEKQKEAEKAKEPEKPKEPEPAPDPAPPPPPAPSGGGAGATFLPNISIVGNLIARGGDTKAFSGRGRSHLEELEVAFQDAIAPKLRYDVFLSAEKEESWGVNLEEGFLTATGPLKNLNIIAGRKRQRFGRLNPLHPHQWLFISQPTSHTSLLGDHGLIADGALAQYILPTKGFYSALEFGAWQTSAHHHEEEHVELASAGSRNRRRPRTTAEEEEHEELGFNGGENGAYSARVHLSKALGRDKELELGASRYWGRGEVHDLGRRRLAVNGLDFSYRSYPGAYRRLWFLAELLAHETSGVRGDTKVRPGGYAMLAYRWNRYWEAGVRGDYSKFPYPIEGTEVGGSLFLTKYLTEQTSLRLEYRHERDPEFGASNGIFFQLLFGSGPHTHEIQ